MGVSYNAFLGPYIELTKKDVKIHCSKLVCANQFCKKFNIETASAYCPNCGQAIEKVVFSKEGKKGWLDEADDFGLEDSLADISHALHIGNDIEILIPNSGDMPTRDSDVEDSEIFEVKPEDITNEIQKFNEVYAREIKLLCELFGKDKFKIKWGLIKFIN